jgi:nicotinate-nucleotide adenylyltransferase
VGWNGNGDVMKRGILGATFDPVHRGHLAIAAEARRSLGLAEVLFVPAGQPVFKSRYAVTPAEHRVEMVQLAIAGVPEYKISEIEIKRRGPSYTVDTLGEFRREYGSEDEMYLILGWDSLAKFGDWREPSRIIDMCYLIAVPRPGWPQPDVKALEKDVPGISRRLIWLEGPQVDISSTAIRELAAEGKPIDDLVPAPVAEYIKKHKLYKTHQEV